MSASSATQSAPTASVQKCNYCAGTGRWTKDILPGKPPESVYCPHCHGSGNSGQSIAGETMTDD